jgi:tripartite ATP-independent transporter DctM subunit
LIDKLFLAGFLPGVLTVVALSAYAGYVGVKSKVERVPFNLKHALSTTWYAKWEIGLPIVIVGGLATGKLRVHEASAFTGLYVLLVETLIYRELSIRKDLPRIIRESMTLVGAILAILSTAIGFTAFLIQAQVPSLLLQSMQVLITSKTMFLLVLNVFLLIAGMVMEIFGAIFVVVPLIAPIGKHFGIDPYHLAIMFLVNLEIAYLCPPLGLNLIISSFRFGTPVTTVYRSVLPFIAVLTVTLIVTTYVPWLSTYLPSLSKEKDLTSEELGAPAAPTPGKEGEAPGEGSGDTLDDLNLDDLTLDDLDKDAPPAPDGTATPDSAPAPSPDAPAPTAP